MNELNFINGPIEITQKPFKFIMNLNQIQKDLFVISKQMRDASSQRFV